MKYNIIDNHSKDCYGRSYLTFKQAKPGIMISVDNEFTCIRKGQHRRLHKTPIGLAFKCAGGYHTIDSQQDLYEGKFYVGLYLAN